jgi:hypothetical protein
MSRVQRLEQQMDNNNEPSQMKIHWLHSEKSLSDRNGVRSWACSQIRKFKFAFKFSFSLFGYSRNLQMDAPARAGLVLQKVHSHTDTTVNFQVQNSGFRTEASLVYFSLLSLSFFGGLYISPWRLYFRWGLTICLPDLNNLTRQPQGSHSDRLIDSFKNRKGQFTIILELDEFRSKCLNFPSGFLRLIFMSQDVLLNLETARQSNRSLNLAMDRIMGWQESRG